MTPIHAKSKEVCLPMLASHHSKTTTHQSSVLATRRPKLGAQKDDVHTKRHGAVVALCSHCLWLNYAVPDFGSSTRHGGPVSRANSGVCTVCVRAVLGCAWVWCFDGARLTRLDSAAVAFASAFTVRGLPDLGLTQGEASDGWGEASVVNSCEFH